MNQIVLTIPDHGQIATPWGGDPDRYTREFSENYIESTREIMRRHLKTNTSNHMDSYWQDGIRFYQDWIKVLDGDLNLKKFEDKWSIIKKQYGE